MNQSSSNQHIVSEAILKRNQDLLQQLIELGFEEETAKIAIQSIDSNIVADNDNNSIDILELAINWIFEYAEQANTSDKQMGVANSSIKLTGRSVPHKMVFVVNMSLKMGAGKMAAQVGHAAVAIYRSVQQTEEGRAALKQWSENGEMKIVLKGDDADHLDQLFNQAKNESDVFVYLVRDAGHTQIPSGSKTVLGVFGSHEAVDKITGSLKLY